MVRYSSESDHWHASATTIITLARGEGRYFARESSPTIVETAPRDSMLPGAAWRGDGIPETWRTVAVDVDGGHHWDIAKAGRVDTPPSAPHPWLLVEQTEGWHTSRQSLFYPRRPQNPAEISREFVHLGWTGAEAIFAHEADASSLRDVVAITLDERGHLIERLVCRGLRTPCVPVGPTFDGRWIAGVNAQGELALVNIATGSTSIVRESVESVTVFDIDARFICISPADNAESHLSRRCLWDRVEGREINLLSDTGKRDFEMLTHEGTGRSVAVQDGHYSVCSHEMYFGAPFVADAVLTPRSPGQLVLLPEWEEYRLEHGPRGAPIRVNLANEERLLETGAGLVRAAPGLPTPEFMLSGTADRWSRFEGVSYRVVVDEARHTDYGVRITQVDSTYRSAVDVIGEVVFEPVLLASGVWAYLHGIDEHRVGELRIHECQTGEQVVIASRAGGLWSSEGPWSGSGQNPASVLFDRYDSSGNVQVCRLEIHR